MTKRKTSRHKNKNYVQQAHYYYFNSIELKKLPFTPTISPKNKTQVKSLRGIEHLANDVILMNEQFGDFEEHQSADDDVAGGVFSKRKMKLGAIFKLGQTKAHCTQSYAFESESNKMYKIYTHVYWQKINKNIKIICTTTIF